MTAKKVTAGLRARIPLIVYNGAFIRDNVTEEILVADYRITAFAFEAALGMISSHCSLV